jgi:hypothetical protein
MSLQEAISEFRGQFRGIVIEPQDAAYDEARKVYNAMIDRRPRLIAKCTDVADVIAAVRMAKTTGLRVSIRGGGHNAAGLGVCDEGLVIDPGADPIRESGSFLAHCAGRRGRKVGRCGSCHPCLRTGSALRHHLEHGSCRADVGRRNGSPNPEIRADDRQPALGRYGAGRRQFCGRERRGERRFVLAVRGGGGNFGVVTSFLFEAHPVSTVCAGPMLWNLEDAADVMKWYREFITQAPEEIVAMMSVPPGPPFPEELHLRKMCAIVWCYQGSTEQANTILEPIRSFRPPKFEFFAPMPFPMLQGLFDGIYPTGLQWYWKADFFKELSDAPIEKHEHASLLPTWQSTMHLYPVNGKVNRVGETDTAFSYRDAVWSEVVVGVDPDPANGKKITDWARGYYNALHPFGAGGAYMNFMMEEGEDRIRATYRGNYARLVAVKEKYDPENFFRVNQNIRPAA